MKKCFLLFIILVATQLYSQTWHEVFSGISNNLKAVVFVNSSNGYVFGEGLYLTTTNSGSNWQQHPMPYKMTEAYFTDASTGFVTARSTAENDTNVVLKTTNGGLNWSKYYIPTKYDIKQLKFSDQNTGFIFSRTDSKIFRTTNTGITWIPFSFNTSNVYYSIDIKPNLIVHAGTFLSGDGYLYPYSESSTDNGVNWFFHPLNSLPFRTYHGFFINAIDENTFYLNMEITSQPEYGTQLYRSTNSGHNWAITSTEELACNDMKFMDYDNGYYYSGFMKNSIIGRTTNGGSNWGIVTVNTPYVTDVTFINSLTGYATADYGVVLKSTNGGQPIGIQTISTEIPEHFTVYQNYPNPFNPSTTIKFEIHERDFVQLKVYNLKGQLVEELFKQELSPGIYESQFQGEHQSSGIYFYELSTSRFREVRKMSLIK